MSVTWSGEAPGLLLALDRADRTPLGHQLQDQLRAAVRGGRLRAGERLPSSRRLCEELQVSRGMVVACYEQLIAEGYLVGSAGSGTRVAAGVREPSARPGPAASLNPSTTTVGPVEIDFEYGVPDLRSAPLPDWLWALHEASRTAPTAVMGDERDAGALHLRRVVAGYHRRVRAGTADAGHAVIVSGFRQGLVLALAVLARSGVEQVALEDPGPREHDELVRRAGMHPVAVPVDGDGLDVDALRRSGARAVVVTPAHQCPTGVVMAPARRHALVAWAADLDATILEDDYDAEFRYDRQPVGSLQGLAPDRVVALGSLSKTLAPGIRLGWLLAPPALVGPVVREKLLTSRGAPALDQLALATLMESGRYDRHVRRMREVYRQRRDTLAGAVTRHAPGLRLVGLEAGCHALLALPEGVAEDAVVHSALRRGVRVHGLSRYRVDAPRAGEADVPPALVLGFGNVTEERILRGVDVLGKVLSGTRQEERSGRQRRERTSLPLTHG
jgi:GntR family transcriptional regulator/MocR family aminotransferase